VIVAAWLLIVSPVVELAYPSVLSDNAASTVRGFDDFVMPSQWHGARSETAYFSTMRITAIAPVRIADAGGWTDTWFAGHGVVCNVAVSPGARCEIVATVGTGRIDLDVLRYGDRYEFHPTVELPGRHPLLESAIARWAPSSTDLHITIDCAMPPGSAVGTSAAVCVALIGALMALTDQFPDPMAVARGAHDVETGLGWQSGIQDQIAAAFGGPSVITMDAFPDGHVELLDIATIAALGDSLVTVYLAKPHHSSDIHSEVIASLENRRDAPTVLDPLRDGARLAASCLTNGDLAGYGRALTACTEGQRALHWSLVSADAQSVIDIGRARGALGWKVNGAGGDGGSVTLVANSNAPLLKAALADAGWPVLDLQPCRDGLVIHRSVD
jgi:D-glycero-alpha-D-manno-heptose-7-phosphate kinase